MLKIRKPQPSDAASIGYRTCTIGRGAIVTWCQYRRNCHCIKSA